MNPSTMASLTQSAHCWAILVNHNLDCPPVPPLSQHSAPSHQRVGAHDAPLLGSPLPSSPQEFLLILQIHCSPYCMGFPWPQFSLTWENDPNISAGTLLWIMISSLCVVTRFIPFLLTCSLLPHDKLHGESDCLLFLPPHPQSQVPHLTQYRCPLNTYQIRNMWIDEGQIPTEMTKNGSKIYASPGNRRLMTHVRKFKEILPGLS